MKIMQKGYATEDVSFFISGLLDAAQTAKLSPQAHVREALGLLN